nr:EOG090X0EJQ [Eulimnadia texana]
MEPKQDGEQPSNSAFYVDGAQYWEKIPASVDGMLGGYSHISEIDIKGSQRFLNTLYQQTDKPGKERALDCGAGIGRITKGLLSKNFKTVDLVEQCGKFLEEAKRNLSEINHNGTFFHSGLQSFSAEEGAYDVIWCQWVLGHLTDSDLISFFKRCKAGLKPKGVIVVKENLTSSGEVEMDHTDSSVTRPEKVLVELIQAAGLKLIREQKQQRFPQELYEVKMFAFRPML